MKKTRLLFALLMTAVLMLLAACGGGNDAPQDSEGADTPQQTYKWSIGYNTVEGSVKDVAAKRFKEIIEEKTEGRVEIELFPNESLGSEQEMLEAVQVGAVDMQIAGANLTANTIPEYALLSLPFLVNGYDEAYAVLDGPIGEKWNALAEQHNLKVIGTTDLGGFAQITNNIRPIHTPEDMKGITMRSPNDVTLIETFRALGSSVSTMPFTEVYLGLSQGVVDGQFNPLDAIYETNFHEVQDYLAITNISFYYSYFFMNNDLFNSLDEELQAIVLEAAEEAKLVSREFTSQKDAEMLEILEGEFVEITTPDTEPFREKVLPVYDTVAKTVGEEAVEELQAFLEEYRQNNQ
ncbi:DctP family TRAP transporter solute-binding subunit [Anaerobacillus sp. MEB173]|uniref:TRAP transporter substrate-binding protein n=1 Tax=Anaerobacillus sp. MEB173 TaxID=3383345 RepID=UPI003F901688